MRLMTHEEADAIRRHGCRWNTFEEEELRQAFLGNLSYATMAYILKRTESACQARIKFLKKNYPEFLGEKK